MFQVLVLDEAKVDLIDSLAYYNSIDPHIAKRFLSEVNHQISLIKKSTGVWD